jgi:hypothetical protein
MKQKVGMINEKNAALWAKVLFWQLQGAEMQLYFAEELNEKDLIKIYKGAFGDFEKLINS